MTPQEVLTALSLITSAAVAIYAHRLSRQSTKESSQVTLRGQDLTKLQQAEARISNLEDYNRRMWNWSRKHIDLYYRYRVPNAPDPDPLPEPADA